MSDHRYYFAYGSNMDPYQMLKERCPGAEPVGVGTLNGFRFVINNRGVATITAEEGTIVYGVVWNISADHQKTLDGYEGVADNWYSKHDVQITLEDGTTIEALVYIDPNSESGKPRPCYMDKILRGAWHFKLPGEFFDELKTWDK